MCLIKLALSQTGSEYEHLENPRTTYLLQATALLESAWSRSKSNFQISLMLVRLYSYLGCGSLAMRAYQRLYLKQIQLDTLSYVMFDRISTLHPHPISESTDGPSKTRSLIELLQKQQKLYKTSREHINKNTWLSFKHGSYNSILEFREVTQKLSYSMSATMSVVESNKIQRFTTNTVSANGITQMHDLIREYNYCLHRVRLIQKQLQKCKILMLPYLTTTTTNPSPISKVPKHHDSNNSAASSPVPRYVSSNMIQALLT